MIDDPTESAVMSTNTRKDWLESLGIKAVWKTRPSLNSTIDLGPPVATQTHPQSLNNNNDLMPASRVEIAPHPVSFIETMLWDELEKTALSCTACGLCKTRRNVVFGMGDQPVDWMVIGEAPGADEDAQGKPFVGQAGKLLDNMLASVHKNRHQGMYIANVLKCRPPNNRNPEPDEVARCEPYLKRQISLLEPKVLLLLGRFAVQSVLKSEATISSLRGKVHTVEVADVLGNTRKIPAVVSYHPAYLLRNLGDKAKSWADLQLALKVSQEACQNAHPVGPTNP